MKLCLTSGGYGLPKRARDRRIVLKAATLGLAEGRTYTEREINEALAAWLREVGPSVESDHVSLRRACDAVRRDRVLKVIELAHDAVRRLAGGRARCC